MSLIYVTLIQRTGISFLEMWTNSSESFSTKVAIAGELTAIALSSSIALASKFGTTVLIWNDCSNIEGVVADT